MKIFKSEFEKGAVKPKDFIRDGRPQIAFAGRSNVGKSSLINSLLSRKTLARTSKTPGRTQQINFFNINDAFYFVDLPGYGFAKVPKRVKEKWDAMIVNYIKDNPDLAVVISIVDARHEPSAQDQQMADWLWNYEIPFVVAATKADKISRGKMARQKQIISKTLSLGNPKAVLAYSSKTGQGRKELWSVIEQTIKGD